MCEITIMERFTTPIYNKDGYLTNATIEEFTIKNTDLHYIMV